MPTSELSAGRSALFSALTSSGPDPKAGSGKPVPALGAVGIRTVYDHEPAGAGIAKPAAITISHTSLEWGDIEGYTFAVRVYFYTDTEPREAQLKLDEVIPVLLETLEPSVAHLVRGDVEYDDALDAMLVTILATVPMEDF